MLAECYTEYQTRDGENQQTDCDTDNEDNDTGGLVLSLNKSTLHAKIPRHGCQ